MDLLIILSVLIAFNINGYNAGETQAEILKGVTIRNWPYADRLSGKYEGYAIDLMNEIADIVGFEYRLYFSPDGAYGVVRDNKVNGMIGEVYSGRADFAVADITVTDDRKKFVDFTEPFMENSIAILINKKNAKNIHSFKDLADSDIKYGTYKMGSTYTSFSQSNEPTIRRMYTHMTRHPEDMVNNAKEGVDKVNGSRFAFLVESSFAEFLSGMYCNLTFIADRNNYFPRQYAIALPKDSSYLNKFDHAIRRLKKSGQLDRIKGRYWKDRCEDSKGDDTNSNNNDNNNRNNYVEEKKKTTIRWADSGYDVSHAFDNTANNCYKIFVAIVFIVCQKHLFKYFN